MNERNMLISAAVIMLIIASLACGSSPKVVQDLSTKTPSNKQSVPTSTRQSAPTPTGQSVPTSTGQATPTPTSTLPGSSYVQTSNVGDLVLAGTHTITLNSFQVIGDVLQANFTIMNMSSENLTVNPYASFEARDSNGILLDQDTSNCPSAILYGSVLQGGQVTGNICWIGVTTDSCEISYAPMVVGGNFVAVGYVVALWEIKK
jgi:hypothetical protein